VLVCWCWLKSPLPFYALQKNGFANHTNVAVFFREVPRATVIDLSYNSIRAVDNDSFKYLTRLKELDLKNNNLQHFRATVLGLHRLDLSYNELTQASVAWLDMVARDRRGFLILGGNKMACNQNMASIFEKATCNEIKEHDTYKVSAETLNGLNRAFHPREKTTLPPPGHCEWSEASTNCSTNHRADMGICLLSAYLDLAKTSKSPDRIFR